MPNYLFENLKTKETKEFFFHMNDKKEVEGWVRIWTNPHAQIDTDIDPTSARDFADKTSKKNYNLGELWDKSAELSEKREKKMGKDFVKEKTIKDYEKRTEIKHPLTPKPKVFEV
jgi:fatty-acid desaturase